MNNIGAKDMGRKSILYQLEELLSPEDGAVTTLANTASLLYNTTENINWLGFYIFEKGALRLGPFMGKPACTQIPPEKGVCGAAYSTGRLVNVADVRQFPGHIACDPASRSELVIPILKPNGTVYGVLDIDSTVTDRFSSTDEAYFSAAGRIVALRLFHKKTSAALLPRTFLDFLATAEHLKGELRHAFTSSGRREDVAAHSWRMALMAQLLEPEFPELDFNKIIRMCIVHDLGEAVTGDIPTFQKTDADSEAEDRVLREYIATLPGTQRAEMEALFDEMDALATPEARFYKALDRLEAIIQHNESDVRTWTAVEYELNKNYGIRDAAPFPFLKELRALMLEDTMKKIDEADRMGYAPASDELFKK